jgi:hypothetical protein
LAAAEHAMVPRTLGYREWLQDALLVQLVLVIVLLSLAAHA